MRPVRLPSAILVALPLLAIPLTGLADEPLAEKDKTQTYDSQEKDRKGALDAETFYAGEVIVTGRRIANMEQAGTSTVVTAKEIAAHGDTTLNEVLDRIPGIQTYTHTKGHTRVRLRGFDQDKVLVLIDGIPVNDVYSTDVDIAAIAVINVSKIIVNRGVSSALYGSDGTVGTINIITKIPDAPYSSIRSEYGGNRSLLNFSVGAPKRGFYYLVNGTLIVDDGYRPSQRLTRSARREYFDRIIKYDIYPPDDPFGKGGTFNSFDDVTMPAKTQYLDDTGKWDHESNRKFFAAAKAGYNFSPNLEVSIATDFYHFEGKTNTYDPNAYSVYRGDRWKPKYPHFGADQDMVSKFALRNRAFVWPYVYRMSASPYMRWRRGAFSLKVSAFYIRQGTKQNGYASTDHRYIKGETFLLKGRGIYEPFNDLKTFTGFGVRVFPSYKFSRSHRINGALLFRSERYLGEEQAISKFVSPNIHLEKGSQKYPTEELIAQRFTLAIEDEMHLLDKLKLAVGISYDAQNFSSFKQRAGQSYDNAYIIEDDALLLGTRDSFNPTAGLVFSPVKRRLRFRASGAIKTRFPTLSEYAKIDQAQSDEGLRPEHSYNANGGVELFFQNKAVSLRGDAFISVIDDRIVRLSKDFPPTNVGRVTAKGAEAGAFADLGDIPGFAGVSVGLSYGFVHARNENFDHTLTVNRGEYVDFTPEHHVNGDIRLEFLKGTALNMWVTFVANQRIYVMKRRPISVDATYNTDYFTTVRLHDPVFLSARLTQKLFSNYELSFTARNLLDDYNANPFNPGPGRTFYLGLAAVWR